MLQFYPVSSVKARNKKKRYDYIGEICSDTQT